MTFDILTTIVFLSVAAVFLLVGSFKWWSNRCTSYNGRHDWKRVGEKYYGGEVIPDKIELHLKCNNCKKEIKKIYEI